MGQPYADNLNLYEVLSEAVEAGWVESLTAAVAWAKRSGLRRLQAVLREIRDEGGTTRLILGIDEEGATPEGLEMALELFDQVHVFNDPSGRTYHPKLYLLKGDEAATLVIGSNNATAGGVYFNYEGAVVIDLDLQIGDDVALVREVEAYIDRLYADEAVCRPLTPEVFEELLSNPGYGVRPEGRRRAAGGAAGEEPEDVDTTVDTEPLRLFGRSAEPKKPAPPLPAAPPVAPPPEAAPAPPPGPPAPAGAEPVRRWSKRLPLSDAYRPRPGSHPTANVRLTKARHPVNWRTFFRYDLFGGADWVPEPGSDRENATIPFHVTVDGVDRGTQDLLLSHAPHRESGQANHTTVLHWGALTPVLSAHDYTDYHLTLERLADGTYHLDLSPGEPYPAYIGP